jgi:DNA-binding IclR family transcriptional regulator
MSTETLERPTVAPPETRRSPAVLVRIQSEYREMPGLALTEPQAARLLGLNPETCRTVLATLVERRVLRRTTSGAYVRASF